MEHRHVGSLESASSDVAHLCREGFVPICLAAGKGHVAVLLVADPARVATTLAGLHRLVTSGMSVAAIYQSAAGDKLWYDVGDVTSAYRLIRQVGQVVELTRP